MREVVLFWYIARVYLEFDIQLLPAFKWGHLYRFSFTLATVNPQQ